MAPLRQPGYPTKNALKSWYQAYQRGNDLPVAHACSKLKYSDEQKAATGATNEVGRLLAASQPTILSLPDSLQLRSEPTADCARYDVLRGGAHVLH